MNTFRDTFERYQKGTASEEEKLLVREEIEKHEMIEEFIAGEIDRMMPPLPQETEVPAVKRITRKVRLKILGVVLLVLTAIALLAFAGIFFCNRYFYDPNEGIQPVYGSDGQLLLDLWAFNELHSPEYSTTAADAWRESPGCYQVRVYQTNPMTSIQETAFERVAYGKIQKDGDYALGGYWRFPLANAFGYREKKMYVEDEKGNRTISASDLDWQTEALEELPPSCQASVYVTFPQDLDLTAFAELYGKWSDRNITFLYAAVAVSDGYVPTTTGFSPASYGVVLENTPEDYPYFQLSGHQEEMERDPSAAWEKHFRDTVTYLSNRGPFLEAMVSVNGIGTGYYNEILSYIDENGMNVYGALISGDADIILSYIEEESPVDFYVSDVRLSVLSRG